MDLTRAQPHGRPFLAAAANAPSHAEHSHWQSSVYITLHDCRQTAGWGNRLPTHHSKTAAQWHYRSETIRRSDCRPTVQLSADTIVQLDYRPNHSSDGANLESSSP